MKIPTEIETRAGALVEAAQKVYDEWEQDDNGIDPELGEGGICQDIASAMAGVLDDVETAEIYTDIGPGHVFLVARLESGVYTVDIPPSVYETGAGYVWKKIEGVVFEKDHLDVMRVAGPMSRAEFARHYLDDALDDDGPGF